MCNLEQCHFGPPPLKQPIIQANACCATITKVKLWPDCVWVMFNAKIDLTCVAQ